MIFLGLTAPPRGPSRNKFSGFLSILLQWPDVDFRNHDAISMASVSNVTELLEIVKQRIRMQRALFSSHSKTPIYVIPTDDDAPVQERNLRVAIVQPMRPQYNEFNTKDPTHWTPGALAEHKAYLSEVCRLTAQNLKAWASAKPRCRGDTDVLSNNTELIAPMVDVILFPELAVHRAHVNVLRRLSDTIKANIFTGLTFQQPQKVGGPINQGLWLIRTASPNHGRTIQYIWQSKHHLT